MNPQIAICAILITLISLFHPSTSANLIQDICKQASQTPPTKLQDCLATFASDPTAPSADLKGLVTITLRGSWNASMEGTRHIRTLIQEGSSLPPAHKDALQECLTRIFYSGLSLSEVREDLKKGDNESVKISVRGGVNSAMLCREALAKGKVSDGSVEDIVDQMITYSNIVGVIVKRLGVN